ncbi:hypothetical protein SPG90_21865 (plasmid) [Enterobacter sp. D2]|uniref:hypothetical protein n=1 Tax=Enterobacter sp. D2 TaxID=3102784 RepID=UPI002ACAA34E|nr:hypothetical protein [Enterobacter sp. D2]MDZ5731135.1 hypothetical protein [Enterobacter sp. D2]
MNKKHLSRLWITGVTTLFILAFSVSTAMAEENNCQLTLSQSTIDYGVFGQEDVVETKNNMNVMSEKEFMVNVYCPKKQKMAVFVRGNTDATGAFLFGNLGLIYLKVGNIIVDGQPYQTGKTDDSMGFFPLKEKDNSVELYNNEGVIAVENNIVPQGQQMSFVVTLSPFLYKDAWRRNSDQSSLISSIEWQILDL